MTRGGAFVPCAHAVVLELRRQRQAAPRMRMRLVEHSCGLRKLLMQRLCLRVQRPVRMQGAARGTCGVGLALVDPVIAQ